MGLLLKGPLFGITAETLLLCSLVKSSAACTLPHFAGLELSRMFASVLLIPLDSSSVAGDSFIDNGFSGFFRQGNSISQNSILSIRQVSDVAIAIRKENGGFELCVVFGVLDFLGFDVDDLRIEVGVVGFSPLVLIAHGSQLEKPTNQRRDADKK